MGIVLLLLQLGRQDFRYRAVSWIIFPLLVMMAVIKNMVVSAEVLSLFREAFVNLIFVAVQLGLLYLYFCIKRNEWVSLTREYLGWGDILFFLASAFFFSFVNFLLFYLVSLILVIIIALLAGWTKPESKKVPLAGCQALFLAAVYGLDLFSQNFDLMGDEFIITMFTGAA